MNRLFESAGESALILMNRGRLIMQQFLKVVKGLAILTALVVLVVWAIAPVANAAEEKKITLRYAQFFPPGHKHTIASEQWCKDLEKRTNGAVKVNHYSGGSVVPPTQVFDSVVKGVVDIGNVVVGWHAGKFPLSDVCAYPWGMPSGVVATKIINEWYAKFKPAEYDEVKVLFFHTTGPGILHTKKPVTKMEDLKGMKIRAFGPIMQWTQELGAVPIGMPMGEAYDALSKGVVEGIFAPMEPMSGYKLAEVVKYHIENFESSHHGLQVVVMNKNKYNGLSADTRKIIDAMSLEYMDKHGKIWDEMDNDGRELALKLGNKFIRLAPEEDARWLAKGESLKNEYIAAMKKKGLPGEEIVKFYRDRIKYYKTNK
jgi:TRAP-type transport system periplasmic protein